MEWSQVIIATEIAVRDKKTIFIFLNQTIYLIHFSKLNIQFVGLTILTASRTLNIYCKRFFWVLFFLMEIASSSSKNQNVIINFETSQTEPFEI